MSLPVTAPQGMAKAADAKKPTFVQHDTTLEQGLHSLAAILGSPRCAADCREQMALGADIEFKVVVRRHHDEARGFCVALTKSLSTPPTQIAWRTDLK